MRFSLAVVAFSFLPGFAQTLLLPAPPARAHVGNQAVELRSTPASMLPGVQVALAPDLLSPEERDQLRPALRIWYQGSRERAALVVLLFTTTAVTPLGPWRNAAAFEADIKGALAAPPPSAPPDPAAFYETLAAATASPAPEQWQTVLWAGRFPDLPSSLRLYGSVWLGRQFAARRIRPVFWTPAAASPAFLAEVSLRLGGVPPPPGFRDALQPLSESGAFHEVAWDAPAWPDGFLLTQAVFPGSDLAPVPELRQKRGFPLPSLLAWRKLRAASEALRPAAAGAREQAYRNLVASLPANPGDAEALDLAAQFALDSRNHADAARWLERLLELEPGHGVRTRQYAHAMYDRGPIREAESALRRARELNPGDALLAERLARVRLGAGDSSAALSLFEESLKLQPGNEDLWWIAADLARNARQPGREAAALQSALGLNPARLDRRQRLVGLLLDAGQTEQARPWVEKAWRDLPAEAPVLMEFARFQERLGDTQAALDLWTRALQVDSSLEPAHHAVASLHLAAKRSGPALAAAETGLERAPRSARLQLIRAQALQLDARWQESRAVLHASAALGGPALLRRRAETEELFGRNAAESYLDWLTALESAAAPAGEREQVARRGLFLARRDDHPDAAAQFRAKLGDAGQPAASAGPVSNLTRIDGGMEALTFASRFRLATHASSFFADWTRAFSERQQYAEPKQAERYREELLTFFQKVAQLAAWGVRRHDRTEITLSFASRAQEQTTRRVLEFLGYKLKTSRGKVNLDLGEKKDQARKQELLSALAIDQAQLEETLESGKPFLLEIPHASVPVLFGEKAWLSEYAPKDPPAGGVAEIFVRTPDAARLYAALAQMEPRAAQSLQRRFGLRRLADRYGPLLYNHGAALALDERGVSLPGGARTAPFWQKLATANPSGPDAFLLALLEKDDGILLAYFASLAQIDPARQAFFTANLDRMSAFYRLFKDSPDLKGGAVHRVRTTGFLEFLRDIPLTAENTVRWPGSAEVWMVARGSSGLEKTQKMMRKVAKTVAPAEEDEILEPMARRRYEAADVRHSQLDNFIAVARLDARRARPLTENEALLLSQSLAGNEAVYPYFAELGALDEKGFASFLRLAARVRDVGDIEANVLLGLYHGTAKLLCLLVQEHALDGNTAAARFTELGEKLAAPGEFADWTSAVAGILRQLPGAGARRGWLESLCGPDSHPATAQRRQDFARILELQRVPALAALLDLVDDARLAAQAPQASARAKKLAAGAPSLPRVEVPKTIKAKGEQKRMFELYEAADLARLASEISQKAARKKPNPKDFARLSREALRELAPPLSLALTGLVYAYYLRPGDLAAAEDPLLLRKHQFIGLDSQVKRITWFPDSELRVSSETIGSVVTGSLAGFPQAAGAIAVAGHLLGRNSEAVEIAQIAALRAAPLWQLREVDLHRFSLQLLAAREWLVDAADSLPARNQLLDAVVGSLPPARRSLLRAALDSGDQNAALALLSLSDLYWLAARRPAQADPSPVRRTLEALGPAEPAQLDLLGATAFASSGAALPEFIPRPPYEDFERFMFPTRLAERVAEFKLHLAWLASLEGLPPSFLAEQGEALYRQAAAKLQLTDISDWRSALEAWRALAPGWIEKTPSAP